MFNMTQEEVAALAGIARSTYAAIESGFRTPSVTCAKKIAKVLNVEWTKFFEEEDRDEYVARERGSG